MIKVELDTEDLKSLVKGTDPSWTIIDDPRISSARHMIGGHNETWYWNRLDKLTDTELYTLYLICKNSHARNEINNNTGNPIR